MVPPRLGRRSGVHVSRPAAAVLSWSITLSRDLHVSNVRCKCAYSTVYSLIKIKSLKLQLTAYIIYMFSCVELHVCFLAPIYMYGILVSTGSS